MKQRSVHQAISAAIEVSAIDERANDRLGAEGRRDVQRAAASLVQHLVLANE